MDVRDVWWIVLIYGIILTFASMFLIIVHNMVTLSLFLLIPGISGFILMGYFYPKPEESHDSKNSQG